MIEKINKFLQNLHSLSLQEEEPEQTIANKDYTNERKLAADVIIGVLTEHICVRDGLLMFPKTDDPSVQAAWHALCHYEADEDIRRRDIEYANQQQELLEMIAFTFKDGKELPANIIASYKPYYEEALVRDTKSFSYVIHTLLKYLNVSRNTNKKSKP